MHQNRNARMAIRLRKYDTFLIRPYRLVCWLQHNMYGTMSSRFTASLQLSRNGLTGPYDDKNYPHKFVMSHISHPQKTRSKSENHFQVPKLNRIFAKIQNMPRIFIYNIFPKETSQKLRNMVNKKHKK